MRTQTSLALAATLVAAALPNGSVHAAAWDYKGVSPSICQPYAPDTTAAELQVTQNGVYNPGTSIEKVICPMPRDLEGAYAEDGLWVGVYYRVLGGTPGRITCTLFEGSTGMQSEPVLTATGVGALASNGGYATLAIDMGAQTSTFYVIPNTMICALSPKTLLGAIYVEENGTTDQVEP